MSKEMGRDDLSGKPENIKEKIDELSVHYYSIRTEKDKKHPDYKTRYIPTVAAATEVRLMLDRTNLNSIIDLLFYEKIQILHQDKLILCLIYF